VRAGDLGVGLENGQPSTDEKGKGREPINTATLPLSFLFIQSFARLNS
jgi:hypothetical protein